MAVTLSTVNERLKKGLRLGLVFVSLLIVLFIFLKIGIAIKNYFYPPGPPKPSVSFGKLPPPLFPESITNEKFNYKIETVSGSLPIFPFNAVVNKVEKSKPNLVSLKKYNELLEPLKFSNPEMISEKYYKWTSSDAQFKQIKLNIDNGNFVLTSPILNDSSFSPVNLLDESKAKAEVENLLSSLSLLPSDLDESKIKMNYLTVQNSRLVEATSQSRAKFIQVELVQQNINGLPIVYDRASSPMLFYVTQINSSYEVVGGNFLYNRISKNSATYPLKTAADAVKDLENGKSYIVTYFGKNKEVRISNIYLAYYIPDQEADFVMPVVVFEGNDGFFAYVSAIKDEWIDN